MHSYQKTAYSLLILACAYGAGFVQATFSSFIVNQGEESSSEFPPTILTFSVTQSSVVSID